MTYASKSKQKNADKKQQQQMYSFSNDSTFKPIRQLFMSTQELTINKMNATNERRDDERPRNVWRTCLEARFRRAAQRLLHSSVKHFFPNMPSSRFKYLYMHAYIRIHIRTRRCICVVVVLNACFLPVSGLKDQAQSGIAYLSESSIRRREIII